MQKVLIVDDDKNILTTLKIYLEDAGLKPSLASSGLEGLRLFREIRPEIVFLDLKLPDMDGLTVLEEILATRIKAFVIIITAYATIDSAVQAIKLADLIDGMGVGVPYIDARQQACDFSCDAVQCVLACPTGSLTYHKPEFLPVRPGAGLAAKPILVAKENDPEPTLNLTERMGVARLTRPEACLAIQGKGFKGQARGPNFKGTMRYMDVDRWKPIRIADHPYDVPECDLCVRECPIKGAISIETVFAPDGSKRKSPVVHEPCVGCGVCEMVCPVEPTAITIEAREVWKT